MAKFDSLLQTYREGMKRDFARDQMPQGSLWNSVDVLPDRLGARERKRGGYAHASAAISSVTSTASYIYAGIHAPFTAADKTIIWDEDGQAYIVGGTAATTAITGTHLTRSPIFYDNTIVAPNWDGTTRPDKITAGLTATALTAAAPAGKYAVVYKDVIWLAAPSASADRIHFAVAGYVDGASAWDTSVKWWDVSFPITGMAALQNAVFVFGLARTARFRGSIPPPDDDFVVDDPIFDVGCTDNRSITLYRDKVIWGNAEGLYFSDGSAMDDLTKICGMKQWWLNVMAGLEGFATGSTYDRSTWHIVTEVFGDYLVYSIMNASTEVDSGLIDLKSYTWHRISNLDAHFMFRKPYPAELYVCRRGASYLATLSGIFNPTASNKADADGTNVLPIVELPYYMGGPELKTVKRLAVTYDVRDAGSDDPYLTVSYIDSPEQTSYTALSPTLTETTGITRTHLNINRPMRGIGIKLAQTAPSSDTRLYDIEIEASARDGLK